MPAIRIRDAHAEGPAALEIALEPGTSVLEVAFAVLADIGAEFGANVEEVDVRSATDASFLVRIAKPPRI